MFLSVLCQFICMEACVRSFSSVLFFIIGEITRPMSQEGVVLNWCFSGEVRASSALSVINLSLQLLVKVTASDRGSVRTHNSPICEAHAIMWVKPSDVCLDRCKAMLLLLGLGYWALKPTSVIHSYDYCTKINEWELVWECVMWPVNFICSYWYVFVWVWVVQFQVPQLWVEDWMFIFRPTVGHTWPWSWYACVCVPRYLCQYWAGKNMGMDSFSCPRAQPSHVTTDWGCELLASCQLLSVVLLCYFLPHLYMQSDRSG